MYVRLDVYRVDDTQNRPGERQLFRFGTLLENTLKSFNPHPSSSPPLLYLLPLHIISINLEIVYKPDLNHCILAKHYYSLLKYHFASKHKHSKKKHFLQTKYDLPLKHRLRPKCKASPLNYNPI